jgi:hypothetical protein
MSGKLAVCGFISTPLGRTGHLSASAVGDDLCAPVSSFLSAIRITSFHRRQIAYAGLTSQPGLYGRFGQGGDHLRRGLVDESPYIILPQDRLCHLP